MYTAVCYCDDTSATGVSQRIASTDLVLGISYSVDRVMITGWVNMAWYKAIWIIDEIITIKEEANVYTAIGITNMW